MTDRAFLSYEKTDHGTLDYVADLLFSVGLGVSGRDYTRDELFVVGSPLQQLQAAVVTIVLVTVEVAASTIVAREIESTIEQHKGIVGLRVDEKASMPGALFDAGAEVLDTRDPNDVAYLPRAIQTAMQSARLLEQARLRGTGLGAPCQRPERSG